MGKIGPRRATSLSHRLSPEGTSRRLLWTIRVSWRELGGYISGPGSSGKTEGYFGLWFSDLMPSLRCCIVPAGHEWSSHKLGGLESVQI